MHALVKLAKNAISEYIKNKIVISPPEDMAPEMRGRAGVFVSLKKGGQLRGCIGTFSPIRENVAMEIIRNALSAATEDPRFSPVRSDELEEIKYSVDVLTAPEKVNDISELNPAKYGVIVGYGNRRGLLLPDLEGVDTVDEQLRITKMKAGIDPLETDVEIYKFEVRRYF
ncbi:MAG: AmmeMemoRadiSam system protein A [Nitrospirae bacterium]|nr:AmmeMemoRadiSam system protein A [Nitrospirota bacterium]MBF0534095.1 AmmeMemoRadiSam system protein A [Nitrospirota bacterium]MBF0618504.1 AmmeMemoRadiSam system protein A [Nitrospirota bacterium]